jgi:hypothetical protein
MTPTHPRDIGLDVHKAARAVASGAHEHGAEVTSRGTRGTRPGDLDHRSRTRQSNSQPRVFVDAAGPCGDGLDRDGTQQGLACGVVAPSLMPTTTGHRVHPDRRAAGQRARLRRSGDLTPV